MFSCFELQFPGPGGSSLSIIFNQPTFMPSSAVIPCLDGVPGHDAVRSSPGELEAESEAELTSALGLSAIGQYETMRMTMALRLFVLETTIESGETGRKAFSRLLNHCGTKVIW